MLNLLFSIVEFSNYVVFSLGNLLGDGYPILYNTIGGIAIIVQFLIFQMRKKQQIILVSILSAIGWILYFSLQGDFISCTSSIIGIISRIIILLEAKHKFARSNFWKFFFVAFVVAFSALTFEKIVDIFPMLGSLLSLLAFFMKKEKDIRLVSLFSYVFFLSNSISKLYIIAMLADITALISIVISLFRYRNKHNTISDAQNPSK